MVTISGKTLSDILGISIRYLRELAKDGIVVKVDTDIYDLTESIKKYIEYKTNSAEKNDDGITAIELGEVFGLSERSIRELATKQIAIKISAGSYDLKESSKNYIDHIKNDKLGGAGTEQLLKKQAERKMAELKLLEAEGNLHRADDIRDFIEDMLISFKTMARSIPTKVATSIANEVDEDKIKAILLAEIDNTLKTLSEYPQELNNGD